MVADCLAANFTYIASVNGCYKVVTHNQLNWVNAQLECRSLHKDAHLLVINNAAEQTAVAAVIDSINRQCFFCFMFVFILIFTDLE